MPDSSRRRNTRGRLRWRLTPLALALAACFSHPGALAQPTGPAVAAGQATFAQQGSVLSIANTPGAIINWQSFSIAQGEITRFLQQSAASAVLNRVVGPDLSSLLGTLSSNGQVFLINPNGIVVGPGALIDTAGFVASTLNITDRDFLEGRMNFSGGPGAGAILNQGIIAAGKNGDVFLIAPNIENRGAITTQGGNIVLAAGEKVSIVGTDLEGVRFEVQAPEHRVLNLGSIQADGGAVGLFAGTLRHSGAISANRLEVGAGGEIVLAALADLTVEAGATITANGDSGGTVTLQSQQGTTLVSGTVEATGALSSPLFQGGVAASAAGVVEGQGGTIHILGHQVGLFDGAVVDASGATGGGTVLVGGDFQGKNPEVQNAFRSYVGPQATIRADALASGNGGEVIVWSDDATRYYGTISARGGAASGDGGFVEVSGKQHLLFDGRVDVGAAAGNAGTLLLDPQDITIVDSLGAHDGELDAGVPAGQPAGAVYFADGGAATDYTLTDEALEALTGNVILQAQRDIIISAGLSVNAGHTVGLELANQGAGERVVFQAGKNISIGSALMTHGAAIVLEADSPHVPGGANGAGKVTISAPVSSNGGGASGGHITLIGGGEDNSGQNAGGFDLDATVNAGAGGISVSLTPFGTSLLTFEVGAGGNTQFSSSDTGDLQTTGALVLGEAVTGGPNGLGTPITTDPATGALVLRVNSLTNTTGPAVQVGPASAGNFYLIAGDGGITLGQNWTTNQDTFITTTGTFTLDSTLNTSNNDLTIDAAAVVINGSIITGTGQLICLVAGCPNFGPVSWDGGGVLDYWEDPLNWSTDIVPTSASEVTISIAGTPTIQITSGSQVAKSLVCDETFVITGGSLALGSGGATFNAPVTVGTGTALSLAGGTVTFSSTLSGTGTLNASGAAIGFGANSASIGTLNLSGGSVSGTGSFTATTDYIRTGGTLATTFSDLTLNKIGDFTVNASGLAAENSVTLISTGRITLDGTVSLNGVSPNAITLSGTGFTNNVGPLALGPGSGRWLVYSGDPAIANTVKNGLVEDFKRYNCTYLSGCLTPGTSIPGTGNGFLYSVAPALTITADGKTKTYGDADPAFTFGTAGFIDGDTAGSALTGGLTRNAGETVAGGPYGINQGTLASPLGYTLSYTGNTLTIDTRAITLTANAASKTYGDADPALTFSATGFVNTTVNGVVISDSAGTVLSGALTRDQVGTLAGEQVANSPFAITQGTLVANSNYSLGYTGADLTIDPAVVSLSGSREFDGTASFAAATFGAVNGVNGETLSLTGAGSVASPKVGDYTVNPAGLALGDGTGLASNYTLAGGAHAGTITVSVSYGFAWDTATDIDLRWENGVNWNQGVPPLNGSSASIPGGLVGPVVYSGASGTTSLVSLTSGSGLTLTGGTLGLGTAPTDVSSFSGAPLTLAGGTLRALGTITGDIVNNGGTLAPGASPGLLTINGNYTQGPSGTLLVELGGTARGTAYDALDVSGSVALDGTLVVASFGGFTPAGGNLFDIIQSGAPITTDFAAVTLPAGYDLLAGALGNLYRLETVGVVTPQVITAINVDVTNLIVELKIEGDEVLSLTDTDFGIWVLQSMLDAAGAETATGDTSAPVLFGGGTTQSPEAFNPGFQGFGGILTDTGGLAGLYGGGVSVTEPQTETLGGAEYGTRVLQSMLEAASADAFDGSAAAAGTGSATGAGASSGQGFGGPLQEASSVSSLLLRGLVCR